MGKIAIITIISRNYGNRLQNYALQESLKRLGLEVETIPMKMGKNSIKTDLKYVIKKNINKIWGSYTDIVWEEFDRKIIWGTYPISGYSKEIERKYEYFIAGSDQIWNPLFDINSDRELLTFAPEHKRIAYAASIGLNEFPKKYLKHYTEEWKKFHKISVREIQAADIIQDSIGKRPTIVLDPTMLLTKNDWEKVMKKPHYSKKFFVSYFLGGYQEEYDKYIKKYIDTEKYDLIELTDKFGKVNDKIGPSEFLGLLNDCEGVFTDSFHGTVFSILFEKPFFVFERLTQLGYGNMNSRIETLIETFKLQNHKIGNDMKCENLQMKWNYKDVKKILEEKRKESTFYLMESMNITKEKNIKEFDDIYNI